MSMADLEDSLSRAVSTSLPAGESEVRRNQLPTNSLPDALQLQIVFDRGGRIDTTESRAPVMPEWTNQRRHEGTGASRVRSRRRFAMHSSEPFFLVDFSSASSDTTHT